MPAFDLEVLNLRDSWVIKLNGRIVSGSATLSGADRVARYAAQSLVQSRFQVSVTTPAGGGGADASAQDGQRAAA